MRRSLVFCAPALLVFSLSLANTAQAGLFYNETFTYPNGNLVGNGPSAPLSPFWAAHSGAGNVPVQVSSNTISVTSGSGSREDVNLSTNQVLGQGQTWYAGFDLTVTGTVTGTEDYFAHFLQGTNAFGSRVYVAPPTTSGYLLGIVGGTSTPSVKWGSDLALGTTYRVVVSYTLDPDNNTGTQDSFAKLWVNPVNESSTSVTQVSNFSNAFTAFAFRQGGGTIGTQTIDNLAVATTFNEALTGVDAVPEPAGLVLMVLGGIAVVATRRQRC